MPVKFKIDGTTKINELHLQSKNGTDYILAILKLFNFKGLKKRQDYFSCSQNVFKSWQKLIENIKDLNYSVDLLSI